MNKEIIRTSVIIPVYNTKRYLRECIDSVLLQSQKEIEIILVDDGSTDGSSEIIKEYANNYPFITAIYQKNQKQGAARNAGARIASGEYIYFLDSDDYIDEKTLSECYKIAKKQDLDFLMFDAIEFSEEDINDAKEKDGMNYDRSNLSIENKVYTGVEFWEEFYSKSGVLTSVPLLYINNAFFKKNDLFFEENVFYEDCDWIAKIYEYAQRITYIPYKFYYRRYRVCSTVMMNYTDVHFHSCIVLLKKLLDMFIKSEDIKVQCMIEARTNEMIRKLTVIIKVYISENRLESMRSEFFSFLESMLQSEKYVFEKSEKLSNNIFVFINMICKYLHGNDDIEIKILTNCKIYVQQYIKKKLQNIPLMDEKYSIGIYGKGIMCQNLLSIYNQYIGEIRAKICFIETNIDKETVYQGYPVYNVNELNNLQLDFVVISSFKYKNDMIQNVLEYGKKGIIIQELPEIVRLIQNDFYN